MSTGSVPYIKDRNSEDGGNGKDKIFNLVTQNTLYFVLSNSCGKP